MKAVIPAAGLGTRLLPITAVLPKEMLPVFFHDPNGEVLIKPVLQVIFENLYDSGFREFIFIVGLGKRVIQDRFTQNYSLLQRMDKNKYQSRNLEQFYNKISDSTITFVNQPEPKGFGDAVLRAKPYVRSDDFLVHAGDDFLINSTNNIDVMKKCFSEKNAEAAFFVEEVPDPRKYGVISGEKVEENVFLVTQIEEKPENPLTNLAVIAIYLFKSELFNQLEHIEAKPGQELQLTDGINGLIENNCSVYAVKVGNGNSRIDIGTPDSYWSALKRIYNFDQQ